MNKLLISTAAIALLASSGSAFANGWNWPPYNPPPPSEDPCTDLCDEGVDLQQVVDGIQEALNNIDNIDDAINVEQTAVNAANLISLETLDLGSVNQEADVNQIAKNTLTSSIGSALYGIEQAATNVVNSLTAANVENVYQEALAGQDANNFLSFGWGGYDADALDPEDLVPTQSAVNAANLIDIAALNHEVVQTADNTQNATNVATFNGPQPWFPPFGDYEIANVYDLGQTATNVANMLTVAAFDITGCLCGYEVDQMASLDQLASNDLIGKDFYSDIDTIVQSATNVANSISMPDVGGDE